jgi:hypothetical protein
MKFVGVKKALGWLPCFHFELNKLPKGQEHRCCIPVGPVLFTLKDSHCGSKKSIGMCYVRQFYRTLGARWILSKLSPQWRLFFEVNVFAEYLSIYTVRKIPDLTLDLARYIWDTKNLKDYYTVEQIESEIYSRFGIPYVPYIRYRS